MSKFQIILLVVFGVFIVAAVLLFSLSKGGSTASATVTVWGSVPEYDWGALSNVFTSDQEIEINYVEKSADTLSEEFTEALAEGRGPDIIILPLENVWQERKKLLLIPFESISERDFKTTFLEEGELFINPVEKGFYALPLSVDPMVLYYNRDHLSTAGMAEPLKYWDEIYSVIPKLTIKDAAGNVIQTTIALGEARNIPHAKEIFSLLSLQAGTPMTVWYNGELRSAFTSSFNKDIVPAQAALDFYTQFSNPAKAFYTWNRALLPAQTNFTSGDSTYYLGFASELAELRSKNPTLNLGVAAVPQSRVSGRSVTYGKLMGVAVVKSSRQREAAFATAIKLSSRDVVGVLAQAQGLPPVRRDLLKNKPNDEVMSVFYESALQSKGWLDPHGKESKKVITDMIESVTSGRARATEALTKANSELDNLIKQ